MSMTYEEILAAIKAENYGQQGRFAPKLDFNARCEIMALYHLGVPRAVLAEAYGIDRRTVTHIRNPKSPHYANVRTEFKELGADEFTKKYINEASFKRIEAAKLTAYANIEPGTPDKNANKFKGIHSVSTEYTKFAHRIDIQWGDGFFGPGWYYQDLDGAFPDQWTNNGPESIVTSFVCLQYVKENLFDV